MNFQFLLPTKIIMETGIRERTGEHLKDLGLKNILVVTDTGVKKAGLLDSIYASLDAAQIHYEEISDVKPNPRSDDCNAAAEKYRDMGIDGLLAVGGGSSMDTAKAVSLLLTHSGKIEDYAGAHTLQRPALPVVVIPTTAGTGSEATPFSVITDTQRHFKMSVLDHRIAPCLALMDPDITATLPMAIAASTGLDALTHAIEAYTGKPASPVTDALALHSARLISRSLKAAVLEPDNAAARGEMLTGSMIAGMALSSADVGSVHCISEAIGGMYDTAHGVANAIFLPFVFKHNSDADIQRHADIAYALGIDQSLDAAGAVEAAIEYLFNISKELGIPHLRDVKGVREEDLQEIAEKSKDNLSDSSNAKEMTVESYFQVIRQAYQY